MCNVVEILLRFIMEKGKARTEKSVLISINKYTDNVWSITVEFL